MAQVLVQQTDANAANGVNVGCSGAVLSSLPFARAAEKGGTPGVVEVNPDPDNATSGVAVVMFQVPASSLGVASWAAGDYVVRINIASTRAVDWVATYICERTVGGVYNTVDSLTGQAISFSTAGVKTMTVNRATAFTPLDADSTLYIVCLMDGPNHGGSTFGFVPDQLIDTPIDSGTVLLEMQETLHAVAADSPVLTQKNILALQETLHAVAADNIILEVPSAGISYIGGASATGTSAAPSITHGLTILAGDVLIATMGVDGAATTIDDDNGANPFDEDWDSQPGTHTFRQYVGSRVAGASEPATYLWALGVSEGWNLLIQQFRGVDNAAIYDVPPSAATEADGSSATATTPAMTTSVDGAEGICLFSADSGSVDFSAYTNSYTDELEPGGGLVSAVVRRNFASSGVQPAVSATVSLSRNWACHQFSLKPAPVVGDFPIVSLTGNSTDDTEDTSATVNLPVGTYNVGDLIVIWAASRDGVTASSPSAGWTKFFDEANGLDISLHAFWRKSDGTESGGTMTFTTSGATKHPAFVAVFTGAADPDVTPPEAPGTAATGFSTAPDPPSSSVSWAAGENNLAVAVVASKSTPTASAFPTLPSVATDTWTNPASGGGGACGVHGGMFYDTARDTIDPNAFTLTGSQPWITDVFWIRPAAGGAPSPIITPLSVTILDVITQSGTISAVSLSASGNERILVIANLVKDNTPTVALVSSITVDAIGVNRTIGAGVTLQGSRQVAQEGDFSNQVEIYFVLEADLPAGAGDIDIDIVMDSAIDYNMWVAFEVTGCPDQVFDAIVQNIDLADVAADTPVSDSITPTVDNCLIVDFWGFSHSATAAITSTETQVAVIDGNANGSAVVSQFTQGAAAAKSMQQEVNQLTQRRAWTLISFAPASGGVTLVMQEALHAVTADSPTLTQANVLAMQECLHSVLTDSPDLTQENILAMQEALHAVTVDSPTLTQANVLAMQEALHAVTADNIVLSVSINLAIQEALHAVTADSPTLTQANALAMQECLHSVLADSPTLTQANILAMQEALHAVTADNLVLNVSINLELQEALHAVTVESPALVQAHILAMQEALHAVTADSPTLTQANVLSIGDTLHAVNVDNVVLSVAFTLAIQEALHAVAAESPALTQANILAVAETLHAVTASNVTLSLSITLLVSDTLHAMFADNVKLAGLGEASEVVFILEGKNRTFIIAPRNRIFVASPGDNVIH